MRTLALILGIICAGCQARSQLQPTDASVNLGGATHATWGHAESVKYNVNQALAYMGSETGKAFLIAALQEIEAVFSNLTKVIQSHETLNKSYNVIVHENIDLRNDLGDERNQWIGDRSWRVWYAFLVVWAGLGIVSMILGGLCTSGPLAVVSSFVLRFLPFANLFIRFRDIIRARGGTTVIVRDALGSNIKPESQ